MPRNASGTYTLPAGNPVSAGTLIEADWANDTMNDLAAEMTDSLSRSGEGGMLTSFKIADGTVALPGLAFTLEPGTGLSRLGSNEFDFSVGGSRVMQLNVNGMTVTAGLTVLVDTINESTTDAGVTVEGIKLKDSTIEFSDAVKISRPTAGDLKVEATTVEVVATDADENAGPLLKINRASPSPLAGDNLGAIYFEGKNAAAEDINYARVLSSITDTTDASEDGRMYLQVMRDGSMTTALRIDDSITATADSVTVTATTVDLNASSAVLVSNDLTLDSDDSVLSFGSASDVTVQHDLNKGLTLQAGSNKTSLEIVSTDADDNVAPNLVLNRASPSPLAGDNLGAIYFEGKNAAAEDTNFARIFAANTDVTDASEDGRIYVQVMRDGSLTTAMRIDDSITATADSVTVTATSGLDFSAANLNADWTINTDKKIQFRDAGLTVHSSADGQLDINADTELAIDAPLVDVNGSVHLTNDQDLVGLHIDQTHATTDLRGLRVDKTSPNGYAASILNDTITNYFSGSGYALYGVGGELRIKSAASNLYIMRAYDSGSKLNFAVRESGYFQTGTDTYSPYNLTTTAASQCNVSSGGYLRRSTSSLRFKKEVADITDDWADKLLELKPIFFKSTALGDIEDNDAEWTYYGFGAEDVVKVDPRYVHLKTHETTHNADTGEDTKTKLDEPVVEGVQYDRMVPALINIIKRLKTQVDNLEKKL